MINEYFSIFSDFFADIIVFLKESNMDLFSILAVIGVIIVSFFPTINAYGEHKYTTAIFILNILGFFIGITWLVALVWSFMKSEKIIDSVDTYPPLSSEFLEELNESKNYKKNH